MQKDINKIPDKPKDNIIPFRPRTGPKLKSVNYVSPEKKDLLKQRQKQKKLHRSKNTSINAVVIFLFIVVFVFMLKLFFQH